jgi:hypothetical protein
VNANAPPWPEPEPEALADLVRQAERAAELLLAEQEARQPALEALAKATAEAAEKYLAGG